MLPLETSHDIEVLSLSEVLIVLRVCVELEVVFVLQIVTIPAIVVTSHTKWVILITLVTIAIVCTKVSMEAQILESVDLVIQLQVTYEST